MAAPQVAKIEQSAGGVIYRWRSDEALEVLLIKDGYGNWGWPKGHVETGETLEEAALRECSEETGLGRLRIGEWVGTTDWYFRAGATLIHKFCDYFLVEADPAELALPQQAEGLQACRWLPAADAGALLTYTNARHVLASAQQRLAHATRAGREAPAQGRAHGK
ncbi:MAG: NUDIX domain-containing protein [Gemmatimonadota bacterium]|nr:MAG: NUDIX domain-containing protein [Gemmatimonadota bacterium]